MYRVTKVIFVLILFMFTSANAAPGGDDDEVVSYKTLLSRNLKNLTKLSVGMTKAEVLETMGSFSAETRDAILPNPYETEPFVVNKTQYEVLYYMTKKYPPFTPIKRTQATPVILRAGKVIGWSIGTLQQAKAGEFEK